jgi:hypothetical protein
LSTVVFKFFSLGITTALAEIRWGSRNFMFLLSFKGKGRNCGMWTAFGNKYEIKYTVVE